MRRNRQCGDFQRLVESPSPVKESVDKNAIKNAEASKTKKNFIRKLFSSNKSIKCDCIKVDDCKALVSDEPLIQL